MSTPTHDRLALRVVTFLGAGMILGLCGVLFLVFMSIQSANQTDPSTVALVSGVSTLVGTAFGALGSILARPSAQPAPAPVEIVNPPENPVPTDQVDSPDAEPDPEPPATVRKR